MFVESWRTIEGDGGTGLIPGDPTSGLFRHLPLPIRDPLPHVAPPGEGITPIGVGGAADPLPPPRSILPIRNPLPGLAPPDPESTVESGTGLNNAGLWGTIAGGFGPNTNVMQQIASSGSNGGVNLQLGPQADFAPVDASSGSGGGGTGLFVMLGLAVVGVLVFLHFHKKHEAA